ncbi:uncharacterized protein MICPUCDRAFT_50315 [Micromonas pusilla CCMP1545]|uniref:Predicted protein n=1 Tax=Micromonas pusilla (strain CCMP1545) TaxID=564608 RepID=C1MHT6_MICPC|nr:uncharacterized protein MICPUCDRAFT_50315 [Micromonas pusilla CCMP1545]EEH60263.1 predicted protein [Micromonas pusilla CCMP1545]|eukprot:XP_003055011.1 predicted protein [Micromonas pusilla CCMP1545]
MRDDDDDGDDGDGDDDGGRAPPLVCAVTSPGGFGCGVACTLRGAPCVLVPHHVLGDASDPDLDLASRAREARATTRFAAADAAGNGGGVVVAREVRLRPEIFLASSPPPPRGRAPEATRLDYVLVACAAPAGAPPRLLRALEESADVDADALVGAGVVLTAAPKRWLTSDDASDGEASAPEVVRGVVSSVEAATARYDARTARGASGAAVTADGRGGGALVAMHRAGSRDVGEGDGEGVLIREILRDIAETTAANGIAREAAGGNAAPAARALLARAFIGERCRAAAAAARAVASDPAAVARAASSSGDGDDDDAGARALTRALRDWLAKFPRSTSFAVAAAHALGSIRRRFGAGSDGDVDVAACLRGVMERHQGVDAVQSHARWALKMVEKRA